MTDSLLTALLPAMNIAVFSRRADGSFSSIAPPPAWFPRIADVTFPFLGHILEEAIEFWNSGVPGSREYGPCAERDETGREFHYMVRSLTIGEGGSQFLIFELDPGSDRLREALQKARDQALVLEQQRVTQRAAAADIQQAAREIQQLLQQLPAADAQARVVQAVNEQCAVLMQHAETMAR